MYIAIDPGGTTGIAWWQQDQESIETMAIPGPYNMFAILDFLRECVYDRSKAWESLVVIVERFATAGRLSHDGLATIELVGAIRGWCWAMDQTIKRVDFVRQQPADRHPFQRMAEEYVIPYRAKRRVVHENDALAHLLRYAYVAKVDIPGVRFLQTKRHDV